MARRITMQEIAEKVGLSKSTVSYVLNGRGDAVRIPKETQKRVFEVARSLGYHPNALARGLAQQRTYTIAVVMQYPLLFAGWSGFTNELLHGVTDAAITLEYDLMLHTRKTTPDWQWEEQDTVSSEAARLMDGRVDGALLLRDVDDPLAEILYAHNFPAVLMFTHTTKPHIWYVDCDNTTGAVLAVEHLLRLGHRRILHVSGSPHSGAAQERIEGYRCAMERAGIAIKEEWIQEATSPTADFSQIAALFQLSAQERPTAVFAWSDDVAVRLMQILRSLGLRIPQDVAIVGFDSTGICDHVEPPLSSVRQPVYDMAHKAVELLHARLRGMRVKQFQIRVAPTLDVRRSCGAYLMS
jgi:LacI family transcriptional regulator